ncbi:MAG: hypothetical protein ACXV2H_10330 [Actinomycetes bacterium]
MRRTGTGAVRRRPALDVVRGVGLSLLGGLGACALALPEGRRPSLVLAGLGAAWLLAALITRWRVVGTVAVFFIACTPLMAGALDDEAATVPRLVVASLLLLVLVVGLDGVEHDDARLAPVAVRSGSLARRWSTPVVALAGSAVVAVAAGAPAVPSVPMVLLGLLAGVGAVVAATRLH